MVDSLGPHSSTCPFHLSQQLGIHRNVPYPVEDLLRVYLPNWLILFLNDLWVLKVSWQSHYEFKKSIYVFFVGMFRIPGFVLPIHFLRLEEERSKTSPPLKYTYVLKNIPCS